MSVRARQLRSRESGVARLGLLLAVYLGLASAQCTFPEYDLRLDGGSGASVIPSGGSGPSAGDGPLGGSGGSGAPSMTGGAGGGSQAGTTGTPPGGASSEGGEGGTAPAPECAPEQWPVERCADTCLHRFAAHCYDGDVSGDESDVDCGGSCQGCTVERCESDADCLSGSCVATGTEPATCFAPLLLGYIAHEKNASVSRTAWSVTLTNQEPEEGGGAYTFRDLKIRYYFERSGVAEPILTYSTQSNLKLASGEARQVAASWSVVGEEATLESVFDAYVEIGFSEGGQLFPGDRLELYQQLFSGDTTRSNFDQRANYSFSEDDGENLRIGVFYRGKLVWGREPQPSHPRACFARAVNFNGPALTVAGNAWQAATQAMVTTTGSGANQTASIFPAVTGTLAKALETSTRLQAGQELVLPVENDTYLVYLYAISPPSTASGHFTLQGEEPDSAGGFFAQALDGDLVWAKMGPYRVDVTNGELVVGINAGNGAPSVNFAAIELWYPE